MIILISVKIVMRMMSDFHDNRDHLDYLEYRDDHAHLCDHDDIKAIIMNSSSIIIEVRACIAIACSRDLTLFV